MHKFANIRECQFIFTARIIKGYFITEIFSNNKEGK